MLPEKVPLLKLKVSASTPVVMLVLFDPVIFTVLLPSPALTPPVTVAARLNVSLPLPEVILPVNGLLTVNVSDPPPPVSVPA